MKKSQSIIAIFVILSSLMVALATQANVTTFTSSKDTYVFKPFPTTCNGAEDVISVGVHEDIYGYVYFDLSSIPIGSNVTSATLRLWRTQEAGPGQVIAGHATSFWSESGASCLQWPGVNGEGPFGIEDKQGTGELAIDVTSIVEEWVELGESNYGLRFENTEGRLWFASKEYGTSSRRPRLDVTYFEGAFAAIGEVTDPLDFGVMCRLHFERVSGSGNIPPDAFSNVLGEWDQSDFTADGTMYRVIPQNLSGDNYSFSPSYLNFSSNGGNVSNLNFDARPEPPNPPINISATPGPNLGEITLSWSSVFEALGYVILYDDDETQPPWDPNPDGNPGSGSDVGNVTSVVIRGLADDKCYYLTVASYNAGGDGGFGDTVYTCTGEIALLKPPFVNAYSRHHFDEVVSLGWVTAGSYPIVNNASTGKFGSFNGAVLTIHGGLVYQVFDSIYIPLSVSNSGNYQIDVYGQLDGHLYAAGWGHIEDMKHGVWVGGGIHGKGYDAIEVFSTMDEGLTTGIREFVFAAASALLNALCNGCTIINQAFMTISQLNDLYGYLSTLDELAEFADSVQRPVHLSIDARQLEASTDYELACFILAQMKGGVEVAYAGSHMEVTFQVDSIVLIPKSVNIGPVVRVEPDQSMQLFSATAGTAQVFTDVFRVTNLGDEVLTGSVSIPAGPFTVVSGENYDLAPGAHQDVDISIYANDPGYYTRTISFSGGGGAERTMGCNVLEAEADLAVYPDDVFDFGSVTVGNTETEEAFTVLNLGGGTLSGTVSVPPPFSIYSGSSFQLDESEYQFVFLSFTPNDTGLFEKEITFTANSGSEIRQVKGTGKSTNVCPTIDVTAPSSNVTVTQGQNVTISWDGTDPDDDATVILLYDSVDCDPFNGDSILIAGSLSEDGSYLWNTGSVPPGTYHIYALIYDECFAPGWDCADGIVTIDSSDQYDGSIYISNVSGIISGDTLSRGQEIVWTMNLHNNAADEMVASNNGFRVYSPDGATWTPIQIDTAGFNAFANAYGAGLTFLYHAATNSGSGSGGDTVGIGGFDTRFPCVGFGASYDAASFVIRIPAPGIDSVSAGKTICIDSSGYDVNADWLWGFCSGSSGDIKWGTIASPYGRSVCYTVEGTLVGIDESITDVLPISFNLEQNYPNPFNPSTNIWFNLPTRSKVSLKVYNLLGNEIKTLVDEELSAGRHLTIWNGRDGTGADVATGIYFYKIVAGDFIESRKMILLK